MVSAVLVAGGRGGRVGTKQKKQFIKLKGRSILWYALQPFLQLQEIDEVVIVLPNDEITKFIEKLQLYRGTSEKKITTVVGGGTRQDSVYNGIKATNRNCEIVLVHDAVRPFIKHEFIVGGIEIARRGKGAIVAVPVKDTIKKVGYNKVIGTIDRSELWTAQTPQCFPKEMILAAYENISSDGFVATDDASICEEAGFEVEVVQGSSDNIKVTTLEDLKLAECLIDRYS